MSTETLGLQHISTESKSKSYFVPQNGCAKTSECEQEETERVVNEPVLGSASALTGSKLTNGK
jgi:hypothetical protein